MRSWAWPANRHAAAALEKLGTYLVIADALGRDGLVRAVAGVGADALIDELNALKTARLRHSGMALTNRLRIEGTRQPPGSGSVLEARRFLTQSIIFRYGYRHHVEHWLTT